MTREAKIPYKTWIQAQEIARRAQADGKTVVTTNGCFDILHVGHATYLEWARQQGDLLIVAINSDESVRKLKGPSRPINGASDRAALLAQLRSVDAVCVFDEDTPVEWLKAIRPQIHVKGGDYDIEKMVETPALRSWGGEVRLAPFVEGKSTSGTIEKMKK